MLMLLGAVLSISPSAWADDFPAAERSLQVANSVWLTSKPDLRQLDFDKVGGVLIIDLRTPAEGTDDAAAQARKLGLRYQNIPVSGAVIEPASVAALSALLAANEEGDVIVHCRSGNRAGLLWGAAQLEQGVALEEVLVGVSGIVNRPGIENALKDYAQARERH
jgi:uncharacterized protein (TIGR01244 family)